MATVRMRFQELKTNHQIALILLLIGLPLMVIPQPSTQSLGMLLLASAFAVVFLKPFMQALYYHVRTMYYFIVSLVAFLFLMFITMLALVYFF